MYIPFMNYLFIKYSLDLGDGIFLLIVSHSFFLAAEMLLVLFTGLLARYLESSKAAAAIAAALLSDWCFALVCALIWADSLVIRSKHFYACRHTEANIHVPTACCCCCCRLWYPVPICNCKSGVLELELVGGGGEPGCNCPVPIKV